MIETFTPRIHSAILTGMAGGAVAQTMSVWGGDLARFLPPVTILMASACLGAAISGLLFAGAFGRTGWRGTLFALLAWPCVTALGAALGAILISVPEMIGRMTPASLIEGVANAAPLGLLGVTDGIVTSPVVAVVWGLSFIALQAAMSRQRAATT